MLVLSRKLSEVIHAGPIDIKLVRITRGDTARIGIVAPNWVSIRRSELPENNAENPFAGVWSAFGELVERFKGDPGKLEEMLRKVGV